MFRSRAGPGLNKGTRDVRDFFQVQEKPLKVINHVAPASYPQLKAHKRTLTQPTLKQFILKKKRKQQCRSSSTPIKGKELREGIPASLFSRGVRKKATSVQVSSDLAKKGIHDDTTNDELVVLSGKMRKKKTTSADELWSGDFPLNREAEGCADRTNLILQKATNRGSDHPSIDLLLRGVRKKSTQKGRTGDLKIRNAGLRKKTTSCTEEFKVRDGISQKMNDSFMVCKCSRDTRTCDTDDDVCEEKTATAGWVRSDCISSSRRGAKFKHLQNKENDASTGEVDRKQTENGLRTTEHAHKVKTKTKSKTHSDTESKSPLHFQNQDSSYSDTHELLRELSYCEKLEI